MYERQLYFLFYVLQNRAINISYSRTACIRFLRIYLQAVDIIDVYVSVYSKTHEYINTIVRLGRQIGIVIIGLWIISNFHIENVNKDKLLLCYS